MTYYIFFIIFIVAIAAYFYYINTGNNVKISNPVKTTGEIVGVEKLERQKISNLFVGSSGGREMVYPMVKFRVEGAKMVRFRSQKGYEEGHCPYKDGETVNVVYDANNPLLAKIEG
ncbi:DUF3592 domain-containing protein [Flexithrix dorotheae]|uniref:DUF3592 domain-containing protein n=1 Tax=Flexithrix dorotheae TaxID=70993 RepID=UPI000378D1B6|nr:DUF3592 domain-containing protein [Flexithrix dorotheae]